MLGKIIEWLRKKLFRKRKSIALGLYGATNAGKTTLANRICIDWSGEPLGAVSVIPHETRLVQKKEHVVIKMKGGMTIPMTILDMPGIAVKVDYRDFMEFGLGEKEAKARAKEATRGIIEAIKGLADVDAALVMMDASEDPYTQVNITILGNLEAKSVPVILVANKIDLPTANMLRIREAFPQYPMVGISAVTGENVEKLYETIAAKF
jgi:50S ribosomal subunit-associated GTPase HflX